MTKRTKRTRKIVNSLTASIMFIVSLSVIAVGYESRGQRRAERRTADFAAEVIRPDIGFADRRERSGDREARISDEQFARVQRDRFTFDRNGVTRTQDRTFDEADNRILERRTERQFSEDARETFSRNRPDEERGNDQVANRFDARRAGRRPVAERRARLQRVYDFDEARDRRAEDIQG